MVKDSEMVKDSNIVKDSEMVKDSCHTVSNLVFYTQSTILSHRDGKEVKDTESEKEHTE